MHLYASAAKKTYYLTDTGMGFETRASAAPPLLSMCRVPSTPSESLCAQCMCTRTCSFASLSHLRRYHSPQFTRMAPTDAPHADLAALPSLNTPHETCRRALSCDAWCCGQ